MVSSLLAFSPELCIKPWQNTCNSSNKHKISSGLNKNKIQAVVRCKKKGEIFHSSFKNGHLHTDFPPFIKVLSQKSVIPIAVSLSVFLWSGSGNFAYSFIYEFIFMVSSNFS